jgi:hypothetical protein
MAITVHWTNEGFGLLVYASEWESMSGGSAGSFQSGTSTSPASALIAPGGRTVAIAATFWRTSALPAGNTDTPDAFTLAHQMQDTGTGCVLDVSYHQLAGSNVQRVVNLAASADWAAAIAVLT